MGKAFGSSDAEARPDADAGPMKSRPRLRAALWLCIPELIVLISALVAALVFALLPHSSYIWGALARSTTVAGIVIALGFPLVCLHSGRAAISSCVWCSANRRSANVGLSQEGAYSKASDDDFSAWWSRRWLTTTLVCDAAVVIVMFVATGVASTGALGVCVKKEIRQAECSGEDCFKLLNVSRVSQLAAGLPASFRFGVSSSAYQTEGGLAQSNWAAFETATGLEPAGRACDAWERFDEDLLLLKKLRVRSYRLSLSWSRLHLKEGEHYDEVALARYRDWCVKLQAAGIEPIVGLLHYEEPQWISAQGSWTNKSTGDAWLGFVAHVARNLSDVVDVWLTENESFVQAMLGYSAGRWAPGRSGHLGEWWEVLVGLIHAHRRAYTLLHTVDTVDADGDGVPCEVGLAMFLMGMAPGSHWNLIDGWAVGIFTLVMNKFFPLAADLAQHADFVGINTYSLVTMSMLTFGPPRSYLETEWGLPSALIAMEWHEDASALYAGICEANRLTQGLPVRVTEHGSGDNDSHDVKRQLSLQQAVDAISTARSDGFPVRSYNHWSFMDSYEWSSGYGPKFGLFSVDFASKGLERTPRESVAVFAAIAGAQADVLDKRPALYSAFSRAAGVRTPTLDDILTAARAPGNRTASHRPARQAGAHQRAQLQLLDQAGSTRVRSARKRAASPSLEPQPGGKTLSYRDFAAKYHSAAMHS